MSGVCGVYCPSDPQYVSQDILRGMLEAMSQRGNGACRAYVDNRAGVALGYVGALASGHPDHSAPKWYEDDSHVVALDGSIFNAADVLSEDRPSRSTHRHTAAIAAALRSRPSDFPAGLDGVFGLAAWDSLKQELWLARDAIGVKPLYYFYNADKRCMVFASELKGILPHPLVRRRPHRQALSVYLTLGYIPAPLSSIEGIHKVRPGEVLHMTSHGQLTQRCYWTVPPCVPRFEELTTVVSQLRTRLIQTVSKYVEGAQRVGVFLSGGLDSTMLLAALTQLGVAERYTFTLDVGSYKRNNADLYWAAQAAQAFGATHQVIRVKPERDKSCSFLDIIHRFDEPHLMTNRAYGSYLLSRAARQAGISLCFAGLGANTVFGLSSWRKIMARRDVHTEGSSEHEEVFVSLSHLFSFAEQQTLLVEPENEPQEVIFDLIKHCLQRIPAADLYDCVALAQVLLEVPEKLLTFMDRMACMHAVEVHNPIHDAELLRVTNRIPPRFKGSESSSMTKAALVAAFSDLWPEGLVSRKKAAYPAYYWPKGEVEHLKRHLLSPAAVERTGLLRPDTVQHLLETHQNRPTDDGEKRIWALLGLQLWSEVFVHGHGDVLADSIGEAGWRVGV